MATKTLVYKYGLPFGPEEGAEILEEIFWKRFRFYNDLIEATRAKTSSVQKISAQKVPEIRTLDIQINVLNTEVKNAYQANEPNKDLLKALRDTRTDLYKKRKALFEAAMKADAVLVKQDADIVAIDAQIKLEKDKSQLRSLKKERKAMLNAFHIQRGTLTGKIAEINARHNEWVKVVRANCGLHNGTYNLVHDEVKRASETSYNWPKFKRFTNEGRVGVQIISSSGRLFPHQLGGEDKRLMILPQAGEPDRHKMLHIQVDTDDARQPIYATFKMVYHRPLPEDAEIKLAWVQRNQIGKHWKWEVCFIIQIPEVEVTHESSHTCTLDVGWKVTPEGHRVASWMGTDGGHGHVNLPTSSARKGCDIIERFEYVDSLQSIRDTLFNTLQEKLGAWFKENPSVTEELMADLPEKRANKLKHLAKLRNQRALVKVYHAWKANRVEGDGEGFKHLSEWWTRDQHLYPIQENYRARTLGARKEFYRLEANRLCERYSTIVIENFNLTSVTVRDKTRRKKGQKERGDLAKKSRRNRTRACISEFREALALMASKYGTEIVKVPSRNTSKTCHSCGGLCELDSYTPLQNCEHCGSKWDRDMNACRNLLRLHETGTLEVPEDYDQVELVR